MKEPAPGHTHAAAVVSDSGDASRNFLACVLLGVFVALCISSVCMYLFNTYDYCMRLLFVNGDPTALMWLSLISPFVLSFVIRKAINNISYIGLCILFVIYAAMIGTCFSFILLDFVDSSLFGIFSSSCLVIGVMAVISYKSKIDLTETKPIMYMLLAGLVIVTPVVFLFPDLDMSLWISYVGIIVFLGLSAFHFDDVIEISENIDLNDPSAKKMALLCSLKMYIDFVNFFFFVVAFFFRRKND